MPDRPAESPITPPNGPVRLNGWKEIASHLGRGVRTVQRWEKEFGLPIRRLGPGRSEAVFAFVHDIDAWQETAQAASARADVRAVDNGRAGSATVPPAAGPAIVHAPAAGVEPPRRRWRATLLVAACLLAVGVGAWLFWQARVPACIPAGWRVTGDSLAVVDVDRRTCWTRSMGFTLDAHYYEEHAGGPLGSVGDLDGDGRREVWLVAVPASGASGERALHVFEQDGTPRWSYQFAGLAVFGSTTFAGPWAVHKALVTDAPEDPKQLALWVLSHDISEFPGLLVRLDIRTGRVMAGPFWNPGWIDALAMARSPEGPRLVVGVTNNERTAPGLVVLDATSLTATTPAELDKYRCASCAATPPLAAAVMPRPARFARAAGSGGVLSIAVHATLAPSPIVATVHYAISETGQQAAAVFRFDLALTPHHADPADNFLPTYEQMVRNGTIPAFGPLAADPRSELLPILRWSTGTRRYEPVGLAR